MPLQTKRAAEAATLNCQFMPLQTKRAAEAALSIRYINKSFTL